MRARKKKAKDYEGFGRQTTLPALKKIDGCQGAYFIKVFEAHKPEYLWVVFWRDQKAFEAARTNPVWREQRRKFEAGKFYKTIPLFQRHSRPQAEEDCQAIEGDKEGRTTRRA
jgi:heme-degrading monooxygenase HmoA